MSARIISLLVVLSVSLGPIASLVDMMDGPPSTDGPTDVRPATAPEAALSPERAVSYLSKMDGSFTENRGLLDPGIRYYCLGSPLSVAFGDAAIKYRLGSGAEDGGAPAASFTVSFEGCRPVRPVGARPLTYTTSLFLGAAPDGWVSGARNYAEIVYTDLWDGIDLRYYLSEGKLKYDMTVRPGARLAVASFRYDGTDGVGVDPSSGDLIIPTPRGGLLEDAPRASQQTASGTVPVDCGFLVTDGRTVSFQVGPYDWTVPLVIDPGINFSTFLGGEAGENVAIICYDGARNICLVGTTVSSDFPTTDGAYDREVAGDFDLYVCVMDPTGSRILSCTFIGGSQGEAPIAARCVDGAFIVMGQTTSFDFPTTPDALYRTAPGVNGLSCYDEFVLRLSGDCSALEYSTYIGGDANDWWGVGAIEADGSVLVAAWTNSTDIPTTPGSYHPGYDGDCGMFVMGLGPTLKGIDFCTYLDGCRGSVPYSICTDAQGDVIVGGETNRSDLSWPGGGLSRTYGGGLTDAFALRMDSDASSILNWTYLGGAADDHVFELDQDEAGRLVVLGMTQSSDFPVTAGALDVTYAGEWDGTLTLLSADLTELQYSTFLGGSKCEYVDDLVLDPATDRAYVLGYTISPDLNTTDGALEPSLCGLYDGFVTAIGLNAMTLDYCTYIGGAGTEYAYCGLVAPSGELYIVGLADSEDFPVSHDAYSDDMRGVQDCFIMLLDPSPIVLQPPLAPTGVTVKNGWTQVNISWSLDLGTAQPPHLFKIYMGGSPDELLEHDACPRRFYVDEELNAGRVYYQVSAVNSAGEGPRSAVVEGLPDGVPCAPANVTGVSGDGTVRVSWEPPPGLEGFPLTYTLLKGLDRPEMSIIESGMEGTTYVDTSVTIGTFYYYEVRAVNKWGAGPGCEVLRVKALDVPSLPTAFTAVASDGKVTLGWGLPAKDGGMMLLGYRLYRGTDPLSIALLATKSIFDLSHTDGPLTNGVNYLYYITAYTEVGEGKPSLVLDAMPFGLPGAVRDLAASGQDESVLLTWLPPESDNGRPITKCILTWGTSSGNLANTNEFGAFTSFTHTGLVNGVTYYYQLRAHNEAGDGPVSAVVHATPMGLPGAVGNLTATVVPDGVRLDWTAPTDTGGASSLRFRVLRGNAPDPTEPIADVDGVSSYVDRNVTRGSTYHYLVVAVNALGEGPRGLSVAVSVAFAPGQVTGLTARPGDGMVALCWTAPDDGGSPITGYRIMRGMFENALAEVGRVDGALTNFTDTTVQNGKGYFYAIVAVNAIGEGVASAALTVTPRGPPGAPGLLRGEAKDGTVVLTWAAPASGDKAPVTGYVVLRGLVPTEMSVIATLGVVTSYTDEGVTAGTTYYYIVHASSDVGDGVRAQAVEVKVPKKPSDGPGFDAAVAVLAVVAMLIFITSRRRDLRETRP